jgi:hypothetical protein
VSGGKPITPKRNERGKTEFTPLGQLPISRVIGNLKNDLSGLRVNQELSPTLETPPHSGSQPVFKGQRVAAFSRPLLRICPRKKVKNLLLLSKRKCVNIPVGNLKVDSP